MIGNAPYIHYVYGINVSQAMLTAGTWHLFKTRCLFVPELSIPPAYINETGIYSKEGRLLYKKIR